MFDVDITYFRLRVKLLESSRLWRRAVFLAHTYTLLINLLKFDMWKVYKVGYKQEWASCGNQQTTCALKIKFDHNIMLRYRKLLSFGAWTFNTSSISCRQSHRTVLQKTGQLTRGWLHFLSYQDITFFAIPLALRQKFFCSFQCTWVGQQVFWSQLYYIVVFAKWKHGKMGDGGGSCRG